ncbi:MAG: hypothetical protein L6437_08285, partial [Kiritimatiellae bacterium]|nr:hypothetical protein [Kiritimatiellia bacterium]
MAFFNRFSSRIVQTAVIILMVLWGGSGYAAMASLWQNDTGKLKIGPLSEGAQVVEDALAKGGKAICLQYAKEGKLPNIVSVGKLELAGRVTVRVLVRGKDVNDVANGLRLTARLYRHKPWRQFVGDGMVYAVRANEKAYRVLPITIDVGDEPSTYDLIITPTWQAQTGERKPVVWIGGIE